MSSFRFENESAFLFLWIVPLMGFLFWYTLKASRKQLEAVFGSQPLKFLADSVSTSKRKLKLWLQITVVVLFVFAFARPQSGERQEKVKSEGVEVLILFDVSQSMLAEDVKPSRMELAKKEISRFLDMGGGDRIGLVAFAGNAVLMSPITNDKSAIKMFIESLDPEIISTQGTHFSRALEVARDSFKRGGVEAGSESVVTKAMIVISDGEDNEEGALKLAKELKDDGMRIFGVAVGTEKGGAIPLRDRLGNLRGYRKDRQNETILSRTKGEALKELTRVGGGSFHHAVFGGNAMSLLKADLDRLEKSQFETAEVTNYAENYQWILFLGILVSLLELALGERKPQGRIWKGRFEVSER